MEQLSPFWFVTVVTLLSGAGGTGLGGAIGALFRTESNRTISLLLAFAGGIMSAAVDGLRVAEAVCLRYSLMASAFPVAMKAVNLRP